MSEDTKNHRQSLIQRYVDQTISSEELSELQELLKSDVTIRNELLLYVRMDIAIRDYVLFHNYMDEAASEELPHHEQVAKSEKESAHRAGLPDIKTLLGKVFDQVFSPPLSNR